nr:MAG TPA: Head fiber protein [Caudoviricetes sp.]
MPAGFKYDLTPGDVLKELCRFDTVYRLSGGFNFEDANIPEGTLLMPLTPLYVNLTTRKASAVKNVKVVEKVTTGTKIKIAKGSLAYKGMHLGDGTNGATVSSISTTNADYDELTMSAALAVEAGTVLFEAAAADGTAPKATANFLNYAVTKVEPGATVTAIGQAYEVRESKLYVPISDKDKETLTSRFLFTI